LYPKATDWHEVIATESQLPPDATRQLCEMGFVVLPGPAIPGGLERLSEAYDRAVAAADPADVRVGSSTRVTDVVNRGAEFDGIYVYPPLLAACCLVIGRPFKLSGTRTRTLEPGAPTERLHVDVKRGADGWPILGFIMMVDDFDRDNGATRFVPGSHLDPREPADAIENLADPQEAQELACGPAGSSIIFDGSAWHGHTANRSARRRRSVQGHFVPREARASVDHAARMRPEVLGRIDDRARYVLGLDCVRRESSERV
jgi:hypothetical protein